MLIVLFRLRAMLRAEEQRYLREMEAGEETVLERQAKMRERAKFLKDKREEERLQFVQEKYDQQFRYGKKTIRVLIMYPLHSQILIIYVISITERKL